MITVLSWFWNQPGGRTTYKPEHIHIWADMVARNLKMKHRIACVTDERDLPPNVERIDPPGEFEDIKPVWSINKPNCFRRMAMFRRDAAKTFGQRFVCMDLDCVIGGSLDPLFDRPEDLVLYKGTSDPRPYNGSMMLIKAGCRPQVHERLDQHGATRAGTEFVGSDQAWLALILGRNEKVWDERDGVYWYNHRRWKRNAINPRLLFFPGKMKPWTLAQIRVDPYINQNYLVREKEAA